MSVSILKSQHSGFGSYFFLPRTSYSSPPHLVELVLVRGELQPRISFPMPLVINWRDKLDQPPALLFSPAHNIWSNLLCFGHYVVKPAQQAASSSCQIVFKCLSVRWLCWRPWTTGNGATPGARRSGRGG